jgi:hypothetical protein
MMRLRLVMKRLLAVVPSMALMWGFTVGPVAVAAVPCAQPGGGATVADPIGAGASCSKGGSQKENLFGVGGVFTAIANALIFVIGAISVIYIIIGGVRYVTSRGDAKAVQSAKDTILYAIIGVVVAIVSFAVVQFVVNALKTAK